MNASLFNACLLVGWLLALAGGCLVNVGWGLVGGGVFMVALVFAVARIAGIYAPDKREAG